MKNERNPVIYLQIQGACGNQFFQYAFARVLQKKHGGRLIINYDGVAKNTSLWEGSVNALQDFQVVDYELELGTNRSNPHKLISWMLKRYEQIAHFRYRTKRYSKYLLWCAKHLEKYGVYYFGAQYYQFEGCRTDRILINGYFESAQYFEEIDDLIKTELQPKYPALSSNKELLDIIDTRESVCITIKRMDVEDESTAEAYQYDINYFYHACDYIKGIYPDAVWIIFSDNIEWCKENFTPQGDVYYETPNNPIWEKIRLMSSCKHFIIHNSTFSWWVQHLSKNKDKIVIAPTRWMIRDDQPIDIYEDSWVFMTNDGRLQNTYDR